MRFTTKAWVTLLGRQKYERAKMIVDGLKAGQTVKEISELTQESDEPLHERNVQKYVRYFGFHDHLISRVGGVAAAMKSPPGIQTVQDASSAYENDEYAEYYEDQGVDQRLAESMAKGAAFADEVADQLEEAAEAGFDEADAKLDEAIKDLQKHGAKRQQLSAAKIVQQMLREFNKHEGRVCEALQFFRSVKQDQMDKNCRVMPKRFRAWGDQFHKQADRYEVGLAKYEAKQAAAAR